MYEIHFVFMMIRGLEKESVENHNLGSYLSSNLMITPEIYKNDNN